jgi:hypothetical protein
MNILKYKSQITIFVDIFLISIIFILITIIFNLCFTEIIYCDSIGEIIANTTISENECVSHNDEGSTEVGLETSSGL